MGGVWTRQLQVDETGEWVVDFCDMSMSNPGYKKKHTFQKTTSPYGCFQK